MSSYTVSLFRDITAKPATSAGENKTATIPGKRAKANHCWAVIFNVGSDEIDFFRQFGFCDFRARWNGEKPFLQSRRPWIEHGRELGPVHTNLDILTFSCSHVTYLNEIFPSTPRFILVSRTPLWLWSNRVCAIRCASCSLQVEAILLLTVTMNGESPNCDISCLLTLTSHFFCYSNLPTTEQKKSLFQQPIQFWLAC